MASASKNPPQNPFSLKPPRPPSSGAASTTAATSTSAEPQIRIPNPNPSSTVLPSTPNSPITMSLEDEILARSSHLTRPELLRRRSHNLKQLAKKSFILTLCVISSPATRMASASKNPQQNPFSLKPPRPPYSAAASTSAVASTSAEPQIRIPNPNPSSNASPSTSNSPITMSVEDEILARSSHLTRPELLRRRSHNLKQLAKCYRDHYWALMEDLKAQHREYYWKFGVSPFKEENHQQNKRRKVGIDGQTGDEIAVEGSGDNDNNNGGSNGVKSDQTLKGNCVACGNGCKSKAMPLTNYCQLHILSDKKQKLYTSCTYVNKRAQSKSITCPKPTLASTVPALCNVHFQKAQKDVARALKDAGHNVSSTNKPPPKLHDIVAAFVHHIQAKRKDPRRDGKLKSSVKEEITS